MNLAERYDRMQAEDHFIIRYVDYADGSIHESIYMRKQMNRLKFYDEVLVLKRVDTFRLMNERRSLASRVVSVSSLIRIASTLFDFTWHEVVLIFRKDVLHVVFYSTVRGLRTITNVCVSLYDYVPRAHSLRGRSDE